MKILYSFLLLLGQVMALSQSPILFRDINIINPWNKSITLHQNIYVENGKIIKIRPALKDNPFAKYSIIECAGKYVIPGLSEMHAHIPVPDSAGDLTQITNTLFLYMSQGVTTIRGMLGNPYHLLLKKDFEKRGKEIFVPNIYTSSPSLNGNTIPDRATADKLVRNYKQAGYHFLKIHPGIKKDVYDQVVKTAKEVNIDFAGHIPVEVGISHALSSGQKTIDHIDGYIEALAPPLENLNQNGFFGYNVTNQTDLGKLKTLVKQTTDAKAWIVPTQSLFSRWFSPLEAQKMINESEMKYMPAKTRYAWTQSKSNLLNGSTYTIIQYEKFLSIRKKILFDLYKGNAMLLLGSDAPQVMNVPGYSIQHEMQSWVDAGIPIWDILYSGTYAVAKFLGTTKFQGKIAKGYDANFIILDQNPIENIAHSKSIYGVNTIHKYFSRKELDKGLNDIANMNE